MQGLWSDFEQFFLIKNNMLTYVHSDVDDANNTDAADDADVAATLMTTTGWLVQQSWMLSAVQKWGKISECKAYYVLIFVVIIRI